MGSLNLNNIVFVRVTSIRADPIIIIASDEALAVEMHACENETIMNETQ